jgi:hypothetical protein
VRRLARQARLSGAEALITTEKDMANLSSEALKGVGPLKIHGLEIGIEVDDEDGLMKSISGSFLRGQPV